MHTEYAQVMSETMDSVSLELIPNFCPYMHDAL